jgi:hypothetical protein
MGEDKAKTKSAMLSELESIKGLLLEDDDIPILQEVIEQQAASESQVSDADFDEDLHFDEVPSAPAVATRAAAEPAKPAARVIVEQQQDFFSSIQDADTAEELLDSLDDLEAKTSRITAQKTAFENSKAGRPSLAKPMGENPFLPQHIRDRLHGNNPPPLFASETARKIATTSKPVTQLGNTQSRFAGHRPTSSQQELIDSIVAKVLPEIEKELRQRLESMSRSILDELNR